MGHRVLIELGYLVAGIVLALAMSWAAAWAYPLGATVIWNCGLFACVVTAVLAIEPIRDAWRDDHGAAR